MDRLSNQTKHLIKLTQELLVSAQILILEAKKKLADVSSLILTVF